MKEKHILFAVFALLCVPIAYSAEYTPETFVNSKDLTRMTAADSSRVAELFSEIAKSSGLPLIAE